MSREKWYSIKQYKLFYINIYHRLASVLIVIFGLNLALSLAIIHFYFNEPDRQYYSTDGVRPPEQLMVLDAPNMTSNPLLPDDPVNEDVDKSVPE
jgi:intracellular multiplication protein IcmM